MRWLLLSMVLLTLAALPARAERVALVIGNGAYTSSAPLTNAETDARDMAAKLQGMGFRVFSGLNLTRQGTLELVQEFARALRPDDMALLYYAGHGVQLGAQNYLVPVDAGTGNEQELAGSAVALQSILRTMELRADARIVILDACRDNPFVEATSSRSGGSPSRGLAKIEAGVGSFIAFATEPGNTAADGQGRNSPFTAALLRHIDRPGADIHAVMRAVRADVHRVTGGLQTPWENSSLVREVYFVPDGATPAPVSPAPVQPTPQVTARANPQPAAPAQRATPQQQYHYVDGLDPNGDNFLALRSAPDGAGYRLGKMGPGTLLELLGQRGNWLNVRMGDGTTGWAHGRWIYCCRTAPTTQRAATPQSQPQPAASCDELWYQRNLIWHQHGYCFRGARGKATFGNAGCSADQAGARARMSPSAAAQVDAILAREKAQGCR